MVFIDWAFSGDGSGVLDPAIQYAGNSAYKAYNPTISGVNNLTHNTFSESQAQVICWARRDYGGAAAKQILYIVLSTYGDANIYNYMPLIDTWYKFRVTFWYDAGSNTKFIKIEQWSDSAWVTMITTNMGAGAPGAGTLALKTTSGSSIAKNAWFDEVEVYS